MHAIVDAFGRRAAFDFSFSGAHYLADALAALGAFVALGYALEEAKTGAARSCSRSCAGSSRR